MKKLLIIAMVLIPMFAFSQTYATKKISKLNGTTLTADKVNLSFAEVTKNMTKTGYTYEGMEVWQTKTQTLYAIKDTPQGVIKKRLPKKS